MQVKIKTLLVKDDIGLTMKAFFKLTPEIKFIADLDRGKNNFKFTFPGAHKSGEQVCRNLSL